MYKILAPLAQRVQFNVFKNCIVRERTHLLKLTFGLKGEFRVWFLLWFLHLIERLIITLVAIITKILPCLKWHFIPYFIMFPAFFVHLCKFNFMYHVLEKLHLFFMYLVLVFHFCFLLLTISHKYFISKNKCSFQNDLIYIDV